MQTIKLNAMFIVVFVPYCVSRDLKIKQMSLSFINRLDKKKYKFKKKKKTTSYVFLYILATFRPRERSHLLQMTKHDCGGGGGFDLHRR